MIQDLAGIAVVALVIMALFMLSSSRIGALIKVVGWQGVVLGVLPLVSGAPLHDLTVWIVTLTTVWLKGIMIPIFLLRALRNAPENRADKPIIGYTLSLLIGVLFAIFAFGAHRFMAHVEFFASPQIPAAIMLALCGLYLIAARRQALAQIIGYLIFENGVYLFGLAIAVHNPIIVELGVLLDVLVGVFIMGIVINQINREFESTSATEIQFLEE